jgi:hypothetical protein
MRNEIQKYLSEIGRRGGRKSKRVLDPAVARRMVGVREARRAYKTFYAMCFWSYDPDLQVGMSDVSWVAEQLRKYGNRKAWEVAARLCR